MAKTVLVVDDSATMRHFVDLTLRRMYRVEIVQACDGVEALEKIRATPPTLIFTDINMPNMDGFELLERIRGGQEGSGTPVIVAIKKGDHAIEKKCMALGASGCIQKPFDGEELVRIMRTWLA